jgi:lipopolysaccharide/colanic/teichoic acid biosynthesis glycosyltransferase
MSKKKEIIALLLVDTAAIGLATLCLYVFSRLIHYNLEWWQTPSRLLNLLIGLLAYWLLIFAFAGLYRSWYRTSRLDEIVLLFKSVAFGGVFILLVISIEVIRTNPLTPTKLMVMLYSLILLAWLVVGRTSVRTFQKKLLENGIGRRRTIIIGWNERAHELCKQIRRSPHYGYDVVGFVCAENEKEGAQEPWKHPDDPEPGTVRTYERLQSELKTLEKVQLSHEFCTETDIIGEVADIPRILAERRISEVLIALDPREHDLLLTIITACDEYRETHGHGLNVKIVPDLYNIISGQARTTQIEGIPLIELEPEIMPFWEQVVKRAFDIVVSAAALTAFLPVGAVIVVIIKVTSRGPALFRQERVGRHGKPYLIYKFRSMQPDAEAQSGPALAQKDDPRVTGVGRWLRRTRLDEFPQFINVLKGEMSIVGPRPERAYFIEQIVKKAPHYIHLHRVRPGITSLGQVKFGYAENIDQMIERSKYDILYIENMSLRMDFKILLHTMYVMLMGRGQ